MEVEMATTSNIAESENDDVSRANLLYLGAIALAGAFGGLLYWIIARWTGTQLPKAFGNAVVLVLMLLGAIAAAVGVYVLTASNVKAIRTYIFAVLCGLSWQPMIDAGRSLAANSAALNAAVNQSAQVGQHVEQIQTADNSGNAAAVTAAVQQAVPAINKTLELSTNVADQDKKTEVLDSSKQAITQLQQSAARAPDASVNGLQNVTVTAANAGAPAVAIHGVQSLDAIGKQAAARHDVALQKKVHDSLFTIATQSKDPSVQTAAKTAAAQVQ
jgi:hypothetical protein